MKLFVIALILAGTTEMPVLHAPADGQRIGAEGDDSCVADQPCTTVHAQGQVPEERAGLFAVMPHNASPSVWIQNHLGAGGGNVRATVKLGEGNVGAKEWFSIYLLSCDRNHGLTATQTSFEVIDRYCQRSEPVTVFRER
jgi:hypothetical protein